MLYFNNIMLSTMHQPYWGVVTVQKIPWEKFTIQQHNSVYDLQWYHCHCLLQAQISDTSQHFLLPAYWFKSNVSLWSYFTLLCTCGVHSNKDFHHQNVRSSVNELQVSLVFYLELKCLNIHINIYTHAVTRT